jgi:CDP-ribitol ribitolphosphotransferase
MRKPMLFFAFDKIQYSFSRGFHRDYEEAAPGKVCYTFAEILDAIEQKDFEYEKVEEYVEKHFDYIDSNASDRVIDWLILGNIPENIQAEIDEEEAFVAKMHELDLSSLKKSKKDELDGEDSEDGADDDDADEDDAEAATEENHDSDGE